MRPSGSLSKCRYRGCGLDAERRDLRYEIKDHGHGRTRQLHTSAMHYHGSKHNHYVEIDAPPVSVARPESFDARPTALVVK